MNDRTTTRPEPSSRHADDPSDARKLMLYDLHRLSTAVSYILLLALGWLGGHRFYLKRPGTACAMIALTLATIVLGSASDTLGAIGLVLVVWLFVDLFLVIGMVKSHNREVMARVPQGMLR